MTTLKISLLGPMQVTRNNVPVTDFAADAAQALLAYLALNSTRPLRREMVAGLLWPEWADSEALRNLRTALYRLRSAIGDREAEPPFLNATRQTLSLIPEANVWVDVEAFAELIAATRSHDHHRLETCTACVERLAEAMSLYRGDFMAGFTLDSAEFEAWMVRQRERLHLEALETLDALAQIHEAQAAHDDVVRYAQRQLALEPWRERAHRELMRALALSGRRAAAVAQYKTCRAILDEELSIEPETATMALYEQIREGALSPPPAAPPQARSPILKPIHEQTGTDTTPRVHTEPSRPPALSPSESVTIPKRAEPVEEVLEQRRFVTHLVADVVGAEGWMIQLDLETWSEIMGGALAVLTDKVRDFGGTVEQQRAEGVVALFGVPVAHEDDAIRAVRAALAMQDAFDAYARDLEGLDSGAAPSDESFVEPKLSLTVGVVTDEGVVTTGQHEAHVRTQSQVIADRVQRRVDIGTLWVDPTTYRLTRYAFAWEPLAPVRVPGGGGWTLFAPVRARVNLVAERDLVSSPLVGRDVELTKLIEAVDAVRAGVGGIVTVVGEAGIGKSRLVAEARRSQPDVEIRKPKVDDLRPPMSASVLWLEGRSLSYGSSTVYQLWRGVLSGLLDVPADCSSEGACGPLDQPVRRLCPNRVEQIYPYVARMLAQPLDAQTATQLDSLVAAGVLQQATFQAMAMLLACVAERHPVVLLLEDLHWSDASSLALVKYLLALTDQVPLLLIAVFRPETTHACWKVRELAMREYPHRHTDLHLRPLDRAQEEALAYSLLQAIGGDERLQGFNQASAIAERAEGNPFFLEEMLRAWVEREVVTDDAPIGVSRALPETVRAVLTMRIDRLPVRARHLLQLASVIGRFFRYRVLVDIAHTTGAEGDGRALDETLLVLQRRQLIREELGGPSPSQDRTFVFKHQLTMEAAYATVLHRKRRVLHRRVAEALERLYPEQVEAQLGLLAHHWAAAGEQARAVDYLQRAAEQALTQYALEEVIEYTSQALALVPEEDKVKRYDLLLQRERAHGLKQVFHGQEDRVRNLAALKVVAAELGDPVRQAEVALRKAQCLTQRHPSKAVTVGQAALALARRINDRTREARAHLVQGRAMAHQWRQEVGELPLTSFQDAQVHLEQARALARDDDRPDLEAQSLRAYAELLMGHGLPYEAMERLKQAIELYGDLNPLGQSEALAELNACCQRMCDAVRGRRYAEQRLEIERRFGIPSRIELAKLEFAFIALLGGDYRVALPLAQSARQWGFPLFILGRAWLDLGVYDRARATWEELYEGTGKNEGYRSQIYALRMLALLDHYAGDELGAISYIDRAFEIAAAIGERSNLAWTNSSLIEALMVKGQALVGLNRLDDAVDAYHEALARPQGEIWMPIIAVEPRMGLAQVAMARGDLAEALAQVEPLLDVLDSPSMDCAMEPALLFLTCYEVLAAHQDARADEVLMAGHRWLMDRAEMIGDEMLRRSYLENVEANRELMAAYRAHRRDSRALGA